MKRRTPILIVFLFFFSFCMVLQTFNDKETINKEKFLKNILKEIKKAKEKTADNPIIFVDDAIGDDIKGNGTEKKPYKTINKALSVAEPENTIRVGSGVYNESLYIPISLTIEGSGTDSCTINGGTSTYTIEAKRVKTFYLNGFTITGGSGACVRVTAVFGFSWIDNCIIKDSAGYGVSAQWHANLGLTNCEIFDNYGQINIDSNAVVWIDNCKLYNTQPQDSWGARITDNPTVYMNSCEIFNNDWGIAVLHEAALHVVGCRIHHNTRGLVVSEGGKADLFHVPIRNQIYENMEEGISVSFGGNVNLAHADITNNKIGIRVRSSIIWLLRDINISGNETGIDVSEFAHAIIRLPTIQGNTVGIHIYNGGQAMCDPNTISDSIISDCQYCKK